MAYSTRAVLKHNMVDEAVLQQSSFNGSTGTLSMNTFNSACCLDSVKFKKNG